MMENKPMQAPPACRLKSGVRLEVGPNGLLWFCDSLGGVSIVIEAEQIDRFVEIGDPADAKAEIERLKGELADSEASLQALDNKLDSLAPHGTCACSYDHPDDFCGHHSPQLMAVKAEIEHLKAEHAAAIEREGREVMEMACAEVCGKCFGTTPKAGHSNACVWTRRAYAEREAKRKLPEPDSGEGR